MTFGYTLTNPSGTVLVAEGEFVPRFIMKHPITVGQTTIDTGLPTSELPPLVFIAGGFTTIRTYASGNTWKVAFLKTPYSEGGSVAFLFGNKATSARYGIRFFHPDGKVGYDNMGRSVRVVGIFGPGQMSLPHGFDVPIAVIPKVIGWQTIGGGVSGARAITLGLATSGQTVKQAIVQHIPHDIGHGSYNVTIIAIDISGL